MAKTKDSRLDNFPKRWASILDKLCNAPDENGDHDTFLDDAQQMSKEEMNKMIIKYNENVIDFSKDMEADMDLANLKEKYTDAASVYKNGIKINQAKSAYLIYLKRSL